MGSFPVTCAISGLPINYLDRIRFLALTQSPFYNEHTENKACMLDDLWFVRSVPLACRYNDSAYITDLPTGYVRDVWMMGFGIDLIEGTRDRRELVQPTSKQMDFNELVEALNEGAVWILSEGGERYRREKKLREKERCRKILAEVGLESFFPHVRSGLEVLGSLESKRLLVLPTFVREDVWQALLSVPLEGISIASLMNGILRGSLFADRPPFQVSVFTHFNLLQDELGAGNVPEGIVQSIAELLYVESVLSRIGFVWRPSTRADQQEVDWAMHARLHNGFARIAKVQHKREYGVWARLRNLIFPA